MEAFTFDAIFFPFAFALASLFPSIFFGEVVRSVKTVSPPGRGVSSRKYLLRHTSLPIRTSNN